MEEVTVDESWLSCDAKHDLNVSLEYQIWNFFCKKIFYSLVDSQIHWL